MLLFVDRFSIALFSALEQTHCTRMWFYMSDQIFIVRDQLFIVRFEYPPKWCIYTAGMAGAT